MLYDDVIYLDYNATTPIDPTVAAEMLPYLSIGWGNPSSSHKYGREAKGAVTLARQRVADMLQCQESEVIFLSGGSEANNYAIKGAAFSQMANGKGNHIISSNIEHPAVKEVLEYLKTKGFEVTYLPVDDEGLVTVKDVEAAITPMTILVTLMHANNEVGSVLPISEISRALKKYNDGNILFHTDTSQTIGKIPVTIPALGVDLLTVTPHKFYGPKGVGALYKRESVSLEKLMHGAGHESGYRAGTENVILQVGLGKASEMVAHGLEQTATHMKELRDLLQAELIKVEGVRVNGPLDDAKRLPNVLSISFSGIKSTDLLHYLEPKVAASAGSACHAGVVSLSPVIEAMRVPLEFAYGTVRLSTGRFLTKEQVLVAVQEITSTLVELRGKAKEEQTQPQDQQ